jgi:hypothetical protein
MWQVFVSNKVLFTMNDEEGEWARLLDLCEETRCANLPAMFPQCSCHVPAIFPA